MSDAKPEETIDPDELAEAQAPVPVPAVIEFEPDAERANAAAASAASVAAAQPRRPSPPERNPDDPINPRQALVRAMGERYGQILDSGTETGRYTASVVPMGALADVALAFTSGLPAVPDYDPYDSPRERFYDHRVPELDPDEYFIPGGAQADRVGPGAMPVGQSFGVSRASTAEGLEVVEIAVRPAGGAEQDPTVVLQLPLRTAQALGLSVLSATWADPMDEPVTR